MLAEYRIVEVLGQGGDPRVFQIQRIALMLGPALVSLNTIIPNFFATNHRLKRQNPADQTLFRRAFPGFICYE
jgi:hypothetical protein